MKLSMTPISVANRFRNGNMDLKGFVNYCAELELDGIDVLDSNCYPWFWKDKTKEFAELPNYLEKANLKLAACATGNNFAKSDPAERKKNVDIVKSAIKETAELGGNVLRVFGGHLSGEFDHATGLGYVVDGLAECLPDAERLGVTLALENHGGLPGHSYEVKRIVDVLDSPNMKVTFDCANFMGDTLKEKENTLTAYERLKDHVVHVHVKDMGPRINDSFGNVEGYVAGVGLIPLRQFVAQLEETGYQGYCSLEYEANAITPERDGIPRSIDFLKGIREIHRMFNRNASQ